MDELIIFWIDICHFWWKVPFFVYFGHFWGNFRALFPLDIGPVSMIPWLLNWMMFWIESADFFELNNFLNRIFLKKIILNNLLNWILSWNEWMNHLLNQYFQFLIESLLLSVLDTFCNFFLIWPVSMIPWLLNWIIFWIESSEFILNWIMIWIELNHFLAKFKHWIDSDRVSHIAHPWKPRGPSIR